MTDLQPLSLADQIIAHMRQHMPDVVVPAAGTEERALWLEAATFHGFEQTNGGEEIPEYDPPAYFATEDEVLALMAAAREQGRKDVLGGAALPLDPSSQPSGGQP